MTNGRIKRSLGELGAVPPLAAVVLLAFNDHVLKGRLGGAVTGKLSDLAICFLLPLLVSATLGMLVDWPVRRRLWLGAAIGGATFGLLEMSDAAEALFQGAMQAVSVGRVVFTRDATDLAALLCVPLAVAYGQRRIGARQQARWATVTGALVLSAGSLSLMATSPPPSCDHWSPALVFEADPGCGPGGLFVVEPNSSSYSASLTIRNQQALGFSPGQYQLNASFRGPTCPYQLEDGDWQITGCADPNPTTTSSCLARRNCDVKKDALGELSLICRDQVNGTEICRSHIKVAP